MGGPNLEVFKFASYLFIPLFAMLHFGDPDWYEHHVAPMKDRMFPNYEDTNKPPRSQPELREELARLKKERRAKAGLPPTDEVRSNEVKSDVLASLPTTAGDWTSGEKRWV